MGRWSSHLLECLNAERFQSLLQNAPGEFAEQQPRRALRFVGFEDRTAFVETRKVTGQATESVCFRLGERLALNRVAELGADRDTVQDLPLGSFVSYNRPNGGRLAGKVF